MVERGADQSNLYDQAALEAELAADLVELQQKHERALGQEEHEKAADIKAVMDDPVEHFRDFQGNAYQLLPGSNYKMWLLTEATGYLSSEKLEEGFRKLKDAAEVCAEIGADPELVSRTYQALQSREPLDEEGYEFLKKFYVGMRKRGYSHAELKV